MMLQIIYYSQVHPTRRWRGCNAAAVGPLSKEDLTREAFTKGGLKQSYKGRPLSKEVFIKGKHTYS